MPLTKQLVGTKKIKYGAGINGGQGGTEDIHLHHT